MKEKLTDILNKAISFVKKNTALAVCVALAVVIIVTVIIIVTASGGSNRNDADKKWGEGITESIPEFDGVCDSLEMNGDSYCAAYYSDVTGDEVAEYIAELEKECNISFNSDKYPRSAVYGDKIIAIHYNVTEKRFSVTVVSKANEDNK